MSSRSFRNKIAAGAVAFTLVLTIVVAARFAGTTTPTGGLGLSLPSLLSLPLVALPFLPGLLEP